MLLFFFTQMKFDRSLIVELFELVSFNTFDGFIWNERQDESLSAIETMLQLKVNSDIAQVRIQRMHIRVIHREFYNDLFQTENELTMQKIAGFGIVREDFRYVPHPWSGGYGGKFLASICNVDKQSQELFLKAEYDKECMQKLTDELK